MNRETFKREYVLGAISDDYENLEQVIGALARAVEHCRVSFDRQEVIDTLSELIRIALAKAYRLSPGARVAEPIPGVPSSAEFEEDYVYFYVTPAGKREASRESEIDVAFDENGKIRPEFCADLNS